METAMQRRRAWQESVGEAPPRWAVTMVKICVIGLLALPVLTMVLLFILGAFGYQGALGSIPIAASAVLWISMFVGAQFLITHYPPVPRAHELARRVPRRSATPQERDRPGNSPAAPELSPVASAGLAEGSARGERRV
jgi:hypothetical protein